MTNTNTSTKITTIDHRTLGNARFTAYLGKSGAVVGYGETRKDAIADLKRKLAARGL